MPLKENDRLIGLSVVIPVYNEAESLRPLYRQLTEALARYDYEVVFIDDGSTDSSRSILTELYRIDRRVRVVCFGRNFGKSEALAVGFRESRGQVIVTMDADLQDDPQEIPRLLATLDAGYDLVSGWKTPRRDPWTKTLPSRLFNGITALLTGLPLHDFNCGFKAYRRRVLQHLRVYGEQHRFIPALAHWRGFRVTELAVVHHPRPYGRSKFGAWRFVAGFLGLFTVLFLTRFKRKPLHLFGSVGLLCSALGLVINLYLTVIWIGGEQIGTRPLLQLGVLLMVMGIQFLSLGLLGEMMTQQAAREKEEGHFYEVLESPQAYDIEAEYPVGTATGS